MYKCHISVPVTYYPINILTNITDIIHISMKIRIYNLCTHTALFYTKLYQCKIYAVTRKILPNCNITSNASTNYV